MQLDGKLALVTGGGTGIGFAIATEFARHGASVVITGRRREKLDEAVRQAASEGLTLRPIVADVTDRASVAAMVAGAGDVDILVNNAGSFGAVGPLWDVDADAWWTDVTINLRGTMLCAQAVLPGMLARNAGTIINLDGGGGADGVNRGGSAYGSSKAAVARLTETLARELADQSKAIAVYGMFPGLVRSEMTEGLINTPERARWQPFVAQRLGEADRPAGDCARAIVALLEIGGSDLSGRIFNVTDDFAEIARRRAEIARDDLYIMRLRRLPKDQ